MQKKLMISMGMAAAARRIRKAISRVEADDVLGFVGLERKRSRFWKSFGLITAGALVGTGAALFFAPASGRETRTRMGSKLNEMTHNQRLKTNSFGSIREQTPLSTEQQYPGT